MSARSTEYDGLTTKQRTACRQWIRDQYRKRRKICTISDWLTGRDMTRLPKRESTDDRVPDTGLLRPPLAILQKFASKELCSWPTKR